MKTSKVDYDAVIRRGTIYDGSGNAPVEADIAVANDRIVEIAPHISNRGKVEIDAAGLAVAPGFINMLSWATESLIADGRSMGDIKQGVTLEVMGEGISMGPWNEAMKRERLDEMGDIRYDITWSTLGQYLQMLEDKGVSTNISSFVGATTVRMNLLGEEDREPSQAELEQMRALVRGAMEEGALGVASALIYAPAFFAKTDELVALAQEAAEFGGMYISHLRSEGNAFLEALDELISIAARSGARAEVYHLKAAGKRNWPKMDAALRKIEEAQEQGLNVTADMYMYAAAQTGLDVAMPPWVQEGGLRKWIERLKDAGVRARVKTEMGSQTSDWENGYFHAGPEGILLVGFRNPFLKRFTGMTLAQVAAARGESPEDTAMNLVIEDESRVDTVYFWMTEENIVKQLRKPWVSVGSDAPSMATEGVFLKSSSHPRAYGNVARFLGKYVREQNVIPLEEAVRRLTLLPATNLAIKDRGALRPGYFADVAIFDPATIIDKATFEDPHQYSEGMHHVFVNGVQVLRDGEHTGAFPGKFVKLDQTPESSAG